MTDSHLIEVSVFDPDRASAAQWAAYHAFRRARHAEDLPDDPLLDDPEFEEVLRTSSPLAASHRFIASERGVLAGNMILCHRRENTPDHAAFAPFVDVFGGVLTTHRRRGVATALLQTAHAFMTDAAQTTATFKVHHDASNAFLRMLGATQKHRMMENRLSFDQLDAPLLAHWEATAATPSNGLRWEVHAGRVPMARLASLMAPFSHLINEQPLGSLEMPRIRYELEGYESWYADMDRRGGEHFLVLLLDGDEVAAMCDASWDRRTPDRVHQGLTAVASSWRGRGLAKGVKAAMLALVRRRHPQTRLIITHNANVNAPMLSINTRLGFAVYRENTLYQIDRDALGAALARRQDSARTPQRPTSAM
ncbi:GNAT family N-acetyltransferase [Variovorax ginsengisoli]|uniref:GNAT superfamily N-acetyltransferase n=1 Tax=Variovorax ginsengisoli TaxID=363844 RepID=A0ABT9SGI3_9BURK|nr:GNAT family N-acetyltransferase [Variovorax ginsengisoli]MDP9902522.1 GNAT superfamily N-acetyltransferase [Variovorax ginsengisoli]